MAKQRLGEILIQSRVINEEQLNRALKFQIQTNCLIGEALTKLGFASEEAVTNALAKQMGIPYASRENRILQPEKGQGLEKLIAEKFAREHLLVPLFVENQSLAIAMSDPTNVLILDNLRLMTNMEIQTFIAVKSQILRVIDAFYQTQGTASLIDRAMEKVSKEEDMDVDMSAIEDKLDLDKIVAGDTKGAQSIRLINAILKQAISERGSDIHLENFDERVCLRFRIDGILYERSSPPKEIVSTLISRIKILSKLDISERRLPQDGSFSIRYQNRIIELRVSVCPNVYGEKLVMRLLDKGAVELNVDKLGFEPRQRVDFMKATAYPNGLIFLTGPTGSGKTTTLNAVLQTIKTTRKNFMTLEDPVEFKISGITQVQVKPQIGLTFASGLRSFLRQDPDVILVGEVRDSETVEACLRAAMTGHLVLSTLHTNEALGAVPRLIDMKAEPFLLASSLALVAGQRLLRVLCPHCRVPYRLDSKTTDLCLSECALNPLPDLSKLTFYKARGCEKCSKTGYLGRKAVYEVFLVDEEMRQIIYKTQDIAELRKAAQKTGAWNMRASGWHKVMQGVTTSEEVFATTLSS